MGKSANGKCIPDAISALQSTLRACCRAAAGRSPLLLFLSLISNGALIPKPVTHDLSKIHHSQITQTPTLIVCKSIKPVHDSQIDPRAPCPLKTTC